MLLIRQRPVTVTPPSISSGQQQRTGAFARINFKRTQRTGTPMSAQKFRRHLITGSSRTEAIKKESSSWRSRTPAFLAALFAAGATLGPALDGIHGTVHLLTYDSAQFYIGGVQSSGWVALLLGTFYAVIGSLHIAGDHWQSQVSQQQSLYSQQTLPYVLASIGTVALLLQISAILYDNGKQYTMIAAVLLVLGVINFKIFEGCGTTPIQTSSSNLAEASRHGDCLHIPVHGVDVLLLLHTGSG
ncbi:hypothetical protein ABBQ32_004989 [Trebouxia sp. C0010 RCD-2024]